MSCLHMTGNNPILIKNNELKKIESKQCNIYIVTFTKKKKKLPLVKSTIVVSNVLHLSRSKGIFKTLASIFELVNNNICVVTIPHSIF